MSGLRPGARFDDRFPVELIHKLTLVDEGQALRTLYVINGVIVYSGLVERLFWEQRSLVAQSFIEGSTLTFSDMGGAGLQYKIADVMRITRAPRYVEWLEQIDALARTQWNEHHYARRTGAHTPGDSWIESYLEGLTPSDAWEIEKRAALAVDGNASALAVSAAHALRRDYALPSVFMR
ncbi:hypothetical protein [Trinickia diaoshuihuensis]|uniref:hypothetical protein n=1 Tax=Trinickia diaoshuihuensis TaxID=2292265 RepID=UPI000E23CB5D|nr:hypothetical protein [Trinickia diaoshuihuensis]